MPKVHRAAKAGTGFGDVNSLLLGEFLVAVLALWPRLHSFVSGGAPAMERGCSIEWVWVEEGKKIESLGGKADSVQFAALGSISICI